MASVNGLINVNGLDYISFRGWANPTIGGIEIDQFGYQIGDGEPVFSADFWQDEPALNNALNSPVAKRYENIKIPVADLGNGVHQIYLLVRDTNGVVYCMNGTWHSNLRIEKTNAVVAENYNVPMESWTVSGHAAGLTSKDKEGHGPMVAAGGLDVGALLHQGAVGVGEVDLSKYSKVVIKFGIDNSNVTLGHHSNNANNRIMLSKVDNNMTMAPADADIIASTAYTPQGWALVEIEIDLTAVDYNGPVFVTYDTLPGTFMLIGSIEFIG
jgi:hypothetical protein